MKAFIFIVMFLFSNAIYAETARELNTKGFRLYKQHKYVEALALFKQATKVNPRYALAFYNAASTLGVLHKQSVCEFDAYKAEINRYLKIAVQLDPRRRKRMKVDSDIDPVRDTFIYQRLLGLRLDRSADVSKILQRVSWYGPALGAYGPVSRIFFKKKGQLTLMIVNYGDTEVKSLNEKARYKVKGNKITIYRKTKTGKTLISHGQLSKTGKLTFDNNMPSVLTRFTDDAGNCEA